MSNGADVNAVFMVSHDSSPLFSAARRMASAAITISCQPSEKFNSDDASSHSVPATKSRIVWHISQSDSGETNECTP